jgi:hypothetical protein
MAGGSWTSKTSKTCLFFEPMTKRRKGFPSETQVKRGVRVVYGVKELMEAGTTSARAAPASGSRSAAATLAAFDGVNRQHYF